MPRPVGSKNRPDARKPGRKSGLIYENYPNEAKFREYRKWMKATLEMIESGEADNITQAAEKLGASPMLMYALRDKYPDWAAQIKRAENITADRLEEAIDKSKNVIGQIFRLKKLRPEYRDNWKIDISSTKLEKLLEDLRALERPKPFVQIEAPNSMVIEGQVKELDAEPRAS